MIKISGQKYEVILNDRWESLTGNEGNGCYRLGKIIISSECCKERQEHTLFHEIMEIINDHQELQLPHQMISSISTAWYAIFKENDLLPKDLLKRVGAVEK